MAPVAPSVYRVKSSYLRPTSPLNGTFRVVVVVVVPFGAFVVVVVVVVATPPAAPLGLRALAGLGPLPMPSARAQKYSERSGNCTLKPASQRTRCCVCGRTDSTKKAASAMGR